jgi:hypothetical protein
LAIGVDGANRDRRRLGKCRHAIKLPPRERGHALIDAASSKPDRTALIVRGALRKLAPPIVELAHRLLDPSEVRDEKKPILASARGRIERRGEFAGA